MTTRTISLALAAAACFALASAAQAQQGAGAAGAAGQPRQGAGAQAGQAGQPGQPAQAAQGAARAIDDQLNQILTQIASDPNTAADKMFLLNTVLDNRAEMELAKQVATQSKNDQVKRLAQRMAQELQKETQELEQTAQALGFQIPQGLRQAQAQEVSIVAALPDEQLDKAFTAMTQADNARDAVAYASQAQIARDAKVKEIAQRHLQAQQAREQQWNDSAQALGMPAGSSAQPAGARQGPGGPSGSGSGQPGTAQPGTAQPGTAQPGTAQPGTAQPGSGGSGASGGRTQ